MSAETIKEFLVGLGVKVDEAGLSKFENSITKLTKSAFGLGAAIAGVAAAVDYGVRRMSQRMESLYYASERTGATAENIQALGYAFSKAGGQAEDALSVLEGIGSFLRSSPGSESYLQRMGVPTRDEANHLRDTSEMLSDLSQRFRDMAQAGKFAQAKSYASVLGISEPQLLVMMRGLDQFSSEYHEMYRRAGVDADQAARNSVKFQNELRTIGAAFGIVWDKIMTRVLGSDLSAMTRVRGYVLDHYTEIVDGVEYLLNKLADIGEWFIRGFKAAKSGQFFAWMRDEWGDLMRWVSQQWAAHGDGVLSVFSAVMTWLHDAFFGLVEDVADYMGRRIEAAIYDAVPEFIRTRIGMGSLPESGEIERLQEELRAKERREQLQAAKDAIGGAFERALNAIIPAANASEIPPAVSGAAASVDKVRAAMDFFTSRGLSAAQAAGIVGNLQQESQLNPNARGDGGAARGIAQWHPDRQAGMGETFEQQLAHVWNELQSKERAALNMLLKAQTAQDAAVAFSKGFERPGDPNYAARIAYANSALRIMQSPVTPAMSGAAVASGNHGGAQVNQKTEITVNGNLDRVSLDDVTRAQGRVNADLVRNMRTSVM